MRRQTMFSNIESSISFTEGPQLHVDTHRVNQSRYTLLKSGVAPKSVLIDDATFVITTDDHDRVRVLTHQSILIRDGVIEDVFAAGAKHIDLNTIDVLYHGGIRGGLVVTPGFINTHSHPPMYLLRSLMLLEEDASMQEALTAMAQLEGAMDDSDYYVAAVGDLTEQQKGGITTTVSHYGVFDPIDAAAEKCGQRVINALSCVSNSHPQNSPQMVAQFLRRKNTYSVPAMALHYVYKASADQLRAIQRIQRRTGAILTLHLAENPAAVERCYEVFGMSEVHTLHRFGLLSEKLIVSHALHCTEEEIRLLIRYRVGISHLPTSNVIHGNGTFPYALWAKHGGWNRISLGTDSVVSKNRLDLLTEALQTRMTHRYDKLVSFPHLFQMVTSNAARVISRSHDLGRIAPGYQADIAFWKLKDRGFVPYDSDHPSTLLGNMITHGGRNVRDLMVNGKFVISSRMHNLLSESKLISELQKHHEQLRKRL
ncbi:MAG: amidohydrolase family protein [Candidatus Kerfeldbacteria bacterium]|nr:amidohydrolase family protein [Candidatus Kerfeldbacteria bacterium]